MNVMKPAARIACRKGDTMKKAPKINPAAIDLLTRVFNTHKKGLPEWMKNAREGYLRRENEIEQDKRYVVINYKDAKNPRDCILECIDFVGIFGDEIERRYLEWANPEAALQGLKPGEAEGGQGSGGKGYLRKMFDKGYFISISGRKLSVVSFTDQDKYALDFVPDERMGKDIEGDSPLLPWIRKYASEWLEAYGLPGDHNITIVRGLGPTKPIDYDRLLQDIHQSPQARQTIGACHVHFCVNRKFRRELKVVNPPLHPAFSSPIKIAIPSVLPLGSSKVQAARPPDFPPGELELCVSAKPLQGQALRSWNRIDFRAKGVSVIGWKDVDELRFEHPQFSRHLYGKCTLPLLVDPKENYEQAGRVHLNEGPLSSALYTFIAGEADKILGQLAKQVSGTVAVKKRKNLEKLNHRFANWIESKLTTLRGLGGTGTKPGTGKPETKGREKKEHAPPIRLAIHRKVLVICRGVSYQLRAVAYDAADNPVPPGKLVWRSQNPAVVMVHPDNGTIQAKYVGLAAVTVTNASGLTSDPIAIQVHEAAEVEIRNPSPTTVGSNRRLQLVPVVRTDAAKALKNVAVSWRSSDERIVTVGQDGWLVGGEVGDAEVVAHVGLLQSEPLEVIVEKGAAGKSKGGGRGRPQILLSGQANCPFDNRPVILQPTDPSVYQRPYKPDYENNVFWINLQHPLAEELLKMGEESVQWRTYHFQRLVDVYTVLEMRGKFGGDQNLDVDQVLDEIHNVTAELYTKAQEELFDVLYDESIDLVKLGVA